MEILSIKINAVCFDMDGTLVRNTDSVKYLCELSGHMDAFDKINRVKSQGKISWIEADHLKAKLIEGLDLTRVESEFEGYIHLIQNIEPVLTNLKERRIRTVLITAGPVQVARVLEKRFGFDSAFGSQYEDNGTKFTGRIVHHLGSSGKLICLRNFCLDNNLSLENCAAVGDSESDIDIFRACGKSIAINSSRAAAEAASKSIITDDLVDILAFLQD